MTLLEISVSPQMREGTSVITSASFTAGSPGAPGTPQGSPEGAEKVMPWAGAPELGGAPGMEGAYGNLAAP